MTRDNSRKMYLPVSKPHKKPPKAVKSVGQTYPGILDLLKARTRGTLLVAET
jgi:hypothetical protein